jgi:hypothetical protein
MAKDIFIYNPTYSEDRVIDTTEETFIDGSTKQNKTFDLQSWVRSIIDEYGIGGASFVSTVFGRIGNVIPVSGDYTASMITSLPTGQVLGTTVQSAINELEAKKVAGNVPISPSTRTKVAYDDKGLVTQGYDATTTDITEGVNLYFTEPRAINSLLGGLVTNTVGPISSTDTILIALGKLQNSLNAQTKYVQTFLLSDWIQSGTIGYIVIPSTIHLRGLNPIVTVKETIGLSSSNTLVDIISNDLSGDIQLQINYTDIFSGKIIIL